MPGFEEDAAKQAGIISNLSRIAKKSSDFAAFLDAPAPFVVNQFGQQFKGTIGDFFNSPPQPRFFETPNVTGVGPQLSQNILGRFASADRVTNFINKGDKTTKSKVTTPETLFDFLKGGGLNNDVGAEIQRVLDQNVANTDDKFTGGIIGTGFSGPISPGALGLALALGTKGFTDFSTNLFGGAGNTAGSSIQNALGIGGGGAGAGGGIDLGSLLGQTGLNAGDAAGGTAGDGSTLTALQKFQSGVELTPLERGAAINQFITAQGGAGAGGGLLSNLSNLTPQQTQRLLGAGSNLLGGSAGGSGVGGLSGDITSSVSSNVGPMSAEERALLQRGIQLADLNIQALIRQSAFQQGLFGGLDPELASLSAFDPVRQDLELKLLQDAGGLTDLTGTIAERELAGIERGAHVSPETSAFIDELASEQLALGESDIDINTQRVLEQIAQEVAPGRGLRPGDKPIVDQLERVGEESVRQRSQLSRGLRAGAAEQKLNFPLQQEALTAQRGQFLANLGLAAGDFQSQLQQNAFLNRQALTGQTGQLGLGLLQGSFTNPANIGTGLQRNRFAVAPTVQTREQGFSLGDILGTAGDLIGIGRTVGII